MTFIKKKSVPSSRAVSSANSLHMRHVDWINTHFGSVFPVDETYVPTAHASIFNIRHIRITRKEIPLPFKLCDANHGFLTLVKSPQETDGIMRLP